MLLSDLEWAIYELTVSETATFDILLKQAIILHWGGVGRHIVLGIANSEGVLVCLQRPELLHELPARIAKANQYICCWCEACNEYIEFPAPSHARRNKFHANNLHAFSQRKHRHGVWTFPVDNKNKCMQDSFSISMLGVSHT